MHTFYYQFLCAFNGPEDGLIDRNRLPSIIYSKIKVVFDVIYVSNINNN